MIIPMIRIAKILAIPTTTFLFGLSGAEGGDDVDTELASVSAAWVKAFNAGDKAAGESLYTEDAMFFIPNQPAVKGRSAIGDTFVPNRAAENKLTLKDKESTVSGDIAFKWGKYEMHLPDGSLLDKGRYLEFLKKTDGKWLLHRDIYSSSLPAVPADMASTMEAINTFIEVWCDGDYDKLDAVVAENFQRISPMESSDAEGLDGIKQVMETLRTAYPDARVVADKVDAYTGGAVVHWTFSGTNTGPGDQPPTGQAVKLQGLTTIAMEDGKIAEEYVRFDVLSWMEQLGYTLQAP